MRLSHFSTTLLLLPTAVQSFLPSPLTSRVNNVSLLQPPSVLFSGNENGIDVSDLGLTLDDLNKPLPSELFSSIEKSGYQSTSRIPDVNDNGCFWVENSKNDGNEGTIDVTLTIPGLRGQPAACLAVLFSTTTISVTAFGRVVWSCIQRGTSVPEECSFFTEDGKDMVPVIQLSVQKKNEDERWDGFILQVGEDSIL